MKIRIGLITLACCLLCLPTFSQAAQSSEAKTPHPITIGVPTDVLRDYFAFMAGRNPASINDYSGPHSRRDVVEVLLIQQALALGGMAAPVKFTPVPTYMRLRAQLNSGDITVAGTSIWMTDLVKDKADFFISDATIEDGTFEAGLYTSTENKKALSATNLADIQQLTATCNRNWTPDWLTLKSLGLRQLQHVQSWEAMVRMAYYQRADFLLAPFQPTEGMLLHVNKMTLAPIHGMKVGLRGSRHFAVSRHSLQGKKVYDALQKGLTILKRRGTLRKAYEQSGFFNPQAKNWARIN